MKKLGIFIPVFICLIIACSPKTAPIIEEVAEEPKSIVKVEKSNPCTTFDDLSGVERDEVETAYVLYKDMVKIKKYEDAFPLWKRAYYGAAAANGSVQYQFDDGVAIYTHMYRNETDETKKRSYVDTIMSIYDKRIECYGDETYILGRKAFDYYYTFPGVKSEDEIFEMFKTNFDINGNKPDYFIVNPFTKMLFDRVVDGRINSEEGNKYAKLIFDAVKTGKANCEGRLCESWNIIGDYAPARLESLEGVDDFYDCEYYADKYYSRYEEDPTNCDIISLVGRRLKRGNCPEVDSRLVAVTEAFKTNCKIATPTGPLTEAYELYNNGKIRESIPKFQEYIDGQDDVAKKFKYTMVIGKIYYGDLKDFPKSRQYARKAIEFNPLSGEPYMLIGKLYASSGPLCGSGRGWNSQVVTWPAIDKFEKAKKLDPSVQEEANKFIRQYRQYMPKKEDIFQRRIKAGDTFKVPCWIQENTIVRTAD